MSRVAFPYPTLFPHIPQQGSWEATIDGNPRFFKEGSGSWDYDSGLEVICRLPWTPGRLFEQAELSQLLAGARLAVVVSTGSTSGGQPSGCPGRRTSRHPSRWPCRRWWAR